MLNRRTLMGAAFAGLAYAGMIAGAAAADEWKAKYPELTFAVVPAENASGVQDRWGPFLAYLTKELGVPVKLRIASDYAAVIEGQRAGNIQIAYHGPASFARARMTGVNADAFAIDVNADGTKGYYSVFYVKADSPYKTIEELKGKNLGLVDPNSTSGNNMPRFKLHAVGIDPETFFGKVVFTGSHENAVLALAQGTIDVAANWWNAEDDSNLTRMISKGIVKDTSGKVLTKNDFRIVVKTDLIINSPYTLLGDLPADLKTAIKTAFLAAPTKAKEAYDKLSDGKNKPWEAVDTKAYDDTVKLVKFVDDLRKKTGS